MGYGSKGSKFKGLKSSTAGVRDGTIHSTFLSRRVAWERGERSDGAGSTGHVQCLGAGIWQDS